jgi:hypothetical protein
MTGARLWVPWWPLWLLSLLGRRFPARGLASTCTVRPRRRRTCKARLCGSRSCLHTQEEGGIAKLSEKCDCGKRQHGTQSYPMDCCTRTEQPPRTRNDAASAAAAAFPGAAPGASAATARPSVDGSEERSVEVSVGSRAQPSCRSLAASAARGLCHAATAANPAPKSPTTRARYTLAVRPAWRSSLKRFAT